MSLGVLAFSYAIAPALYDDTDDIIGHYLCGILGCSHYPGLQLQTFLVYFLYSVLAIVIILPVIFLFKRKFALQGETVATKGQAVMPASPNLLLVALVNAAVMTVLNTITTY